MLTNNLIGKRYKTLTVIEERLADTHGHARWLVRCSDCKSEHVVVGNNLTSGGTLGCRYCSAFRFTVKEAMDMLELKNAGYTYSKLGEVYGIDRSVAFSNVKRARMLTNRFSEVEQI